MKNRDGTREGDEGQHTQGWEMRTRAYIGGRWKDGRKGGRKEGGQRREIRWVDKRHEEEMMMMRGTRTNK